MVKDGGFSPLQVSELASAVGTAELKANGPLRQIRTMFAASLEDPTANSIAQAEWAYRNDDEIAVLLTSLTGGTLRKRGLGFVYRGEVR